MVDPNNATTPDPGINPDPGIPRVTGTGNEVDINYNAPVVDTTNPGTGEPATQDIEDFFSQQATSPSTFPGTEQVAVGIEEQSDEIIDQDAVLAPTQSVPDTQSTQAQNVTGTAVTVTDQALANLLDITPGTYESASTNGAVGEVTPEQLLRTQLANLVDDVDSGNAPWADIAIRTANDLMLKRGIGASSLAGAAISRAVIEAAIPIAKFDAEQYGQINIENIRNRQTALLSNQAAENAARNFNAENTQETDQFIAGLRDRVLRDNAERLNAMEQFSKAETNKTSQFNAGQDNAIKQFRDKQEAENNQFIATNQLTISKNNSEWRRSINTANTAAQNAALQINAQNRFNLSAQAQANLWERSNDIFDHANTVAENARDRAFQVVLFSLSRDAQIEDLDAAERADTFAALGTLATNFITSGSGQGLLNSLGTAVTNIFSTGDDAPNFTFDDQVPVGEDPFL
tara:strand:+ start:282 stop:1661 length:1380 start_codon:yes stop_codon:yes gene_type:complete